MRGSSFPPPPQVRRSCYMSPSLVPRPRVVRNRARLVEPSAQLTCHMIPTPGQLFSYPRFRTHDWSRWVFLFPRLRLRVCLLVTFLARPRHGCHVRCGLVHAGGRTGRHDRCPICLELFTKPSSSGGLAPVLLYYRALTFGSDTLGLHTPSLHLR